MRAFASGLSVLASLCLAGAAFADAVPQALPFSQDWSNTGLITVNDDWSGVPGILGFLGDNAATSVTGVNPTALVGDSSGVVDVIANQANPNTQTAGGVAEFQIADPVVALQGSGTADFPHLRIHLNTIGYQSVTFACNLRDVDGAADNAVQPIAVQYRVGNAGSWTNLAGGYVADATTGPSLATLVTPISIVLPGDADNQAEVQVRVMTTNAAGSDEWVGVDDIVVTGQELPVPVESRSWGQVKSGN